MPEELRFISAEEDRQIKIDALREKARAHATIYVCLLFFFMLIFILDLLDVPAVNGLSIFILPLQISTFFWGRWRQDKIDRQITEARRGRF